MEGARNRESSVATAALMGRRGKDTICEEEHDVGAGLVQSQRRKATPSLHATNTPPWPSQARQPLLTWREAPRVFTSIQRPPAQTSSAEGDSTNLVRPQHRCELCEG